MFRLSRGMTEDIMNAREIIEIIQWELYSLFVCFIQNYIRFTNIILNRKSLFKMIFLYT